MDDISCNTAEKIDQESGKEVVRREGVGANFHPKKKADLLCLFLQACSWGGGEEGVYL
jgi:hypothetical protein